MLALRDQENLVHGQQTAAAAKPLNHGLRQLPPKTPGNRIPKTPFRVPLNDENAPLGFGTGKNVLRTIGRGNENVHTVGRKDLSAQKSAYVTPLGPRNRAPLGMKTTNAKAKEYQTPGLDQNSALAPHQKSHTSNVLHSKIDAAQGQNGNEVPDVEYAPPNPQPLPDYPDDWPHDLEYPMFKGNNLTRGWAELHAEPVGEDGMTSSGRKMQQQQEKFDKEIDSIIAREVDKLRLEPPDLDFVEEEVNRPVVHVNKTKKRASKVPVLSKGPSQSASRRAATLLSSSKQPPNVIRSRRSIVPTRVRIPPLQTRKRTTSSLNTSSMRHTAAVATSRTTLGYSRGRMTSTNYRLHCEKKKTPKKNETDEEDPNSLLPAVYIQKYGKPLPLTSMWNRCRVLGLLDENNDKDEAVDELLCGSGPMLDEALEDFELPVPT